MKTKIIFIERTFWEFVSIEKVFRQIAKTLSKKKFEYEFEKLKFGNNLKGIIKNLLFFKKKKADIYHITGHVHYIALKFAKVNTILTIHDLGFLRSNHGLKRYLLKKLYLDIPVKKLEYITTISEATKEEIIQQTSCHENKIRVIENPLAEEFKISQKKPFDQKYPRILQIGTTPNKNVANLIYALNGIPCRLEIIGRLNETLTFLLEENNIDYVNSFGLNDQQIVKKYKIADMVTFCSTFEGFGLPIIEAQAMKTPVLTSNIDPLKDVAGKGALLIDPFDTNEIRKGIKQIIDVASVRKTMVENGLENIKRFDSKEISKKYENLYREVLNGLGQIDD